MRRFAKPAAWAMLLLASRAATSAADDVKYFEKDGVTYRETRQVVRRPVVETKLEARDCTVYRDKLTTEVQDVPRSYPVAITEYHWVPVVRRSWNPFSPPYVAYEMVPQTRWETRSDTVKATITRRQVVPEKVTQHVPVTTHRYVEDEIISRVAVGTRPAAAANTAIAGTPAVTAPGMLPATPGATATGDSSMANRTAVGGVMKLDTDPAKGPSDWRPAVGDPARRY